jgi:prepilin-type N-terminal cleavage/methylation domain-containing protein
MVKMRGFDSGRGFTLFEFVLVISIIAILAKVLVGRIDSTAAIAEKTAMEATVNQINTALLFEFADNVIHNTRGKISGMAGRNPVDWLAQPPSNYVGEFSTAPQPSEVAGSWYFDTTDHVMVYMVRRGDDFQPDSAGIKRVRYRIKLLYDNSEPPGTVGVILSPVEPYKWF